MSSEKGPLPDFHSVLTQAIKYREAEEFELERDVYQGFLEHFPNDPTILGGLIKVLLELGQHEEVAEIASRHEDLFHHTLEYAVESLLILGRHSEAQKLRIRISRGRIEHAAESIQIYSELAREEPKDPVSHFMLAICYRELEQYDEAIAALRKTMELEPGQENHERFLAELEAEKGMHDANN